MEQRNQSEPVSEENPSGNMKESYCGVRLSVWLTLGKLFLLIKPQFLHFLNNRGSGSYLAGEVVKLILGKCLERG